MSTRSRRTRPLHLLLCAISAASLLCASGCPPGEDDGGVDDAGDGDGDGDEEVDAGACAGGACSPDGGPVSGDGDGDGDGGVTGGPIDGVWYVNVATCDGQPALPPGAVFVLTIDDGVGSFEQAFTPNCVVNLDEQYAYPDATTFSITPTAVGCSPDTDCPIFFGGQSCVPLPPPVDFSYTLDGDLLVFNRVAEGPQDAPCSPGQQVRFEMGPECLVCGGADGGTTDGG